MTETRSIVLDELGSLDAEPGSREWALAARYRIQSLLKDGQSNAWHLRNWTAAMEEHLGYRQLTDRDGRPFRSYREFCVAKPPFGLGYPPEEIERIRKERETAQSLAETAEPEATHGGDRKSGEYQVDNIKLNGGTSADYLTRRIARDRPDILERMKQGEYKSVRQAALEAGIVKPTITMPEDVTAIARVLKRRLTPEQLAQLRDLLANP